MKRLTGGAGANVILDMVGGDYLPRNIACLAEDGRHVSIATQRGVTAEVNILDVMRRRLTLTGSTLRPRTTAFKGLVAEELRREVVLRRGPGVAGQTAMGRGERAHATPGHRRPQHLADERAVVLRPLGAWLERLRECVVDDPDGGPVRRDRRRRVVPAVAPDLDRPGCDPRRAAVGRRAEHHLLVV